MFEQLNLLQGCPSALVRFQQWVVAAVISPFAEFFARNGLFAVVILGFYHGVPHQ